MDYVEKLNIRDVLYLIHDAELRNSINKVSIENHENELVAASVLYSKFLEEKEYTDTEIAAEHAFVVEQLGIKDTEIAAEHAFTIAQVANEHSFTVEELAKKVNLQMFLDFINNSLATVATTGSYNDLSDKPKSWEGGITVTGTALVIDTTADGLSPEEVSELEAIIGSGEL